MKNIEKKFAVVKDGRSWLAVSGVVVTAMGMVPTGASAHGFVGDYFFPPTITTDDPFAVDEFPFPTISWFKTPGVGGAPAVETTDLGFQINKEIFPKFALSFSGDYLWQKPDGQSGVSGWADFVAGAKYQLWQNVPHYAIFSVGALWQIGGSGSSEVGADPAHVFTPTIYYGKAFADLPDSLQYARPVAVTGTLGLSFPTKAEPNNLEWGFSVQYSLLYLQEQVKDIGLPAPFRTMIPLVEFTMTSPLNRSGGQTTGTVNPGILYENPRFQIGAEALIPVNSASGHQVGFIAQFELFFDDIWPNVFGHPIFGRHSQGE